VRELTGRVQGVMPREAEQQAERLQRLQEELFEPQRTKDDVEAMQVGRFPNAVEASFSGLLYCIAESALKESSSCLVN
jgi:hypothetical protein